MLPKDLHNALVRITAEKSGTPVGTGFVCYQDHDGTLILTCRLVLDMVADLTAPEVHPKRAVWIDGQYEAVPVFESERDVPIDLAVLKCAAAPLRERPVLPLGQPLVMGETRIINYQSIRFSDTSRVTEKPLVYAYQLMSDSENELILRNDSDFSIGADNIGSPVIDQNWVVGVVTRAAHVTSSRAK